MKHMQNSYRAFYRQFFAIVIPIAMQNLISSAVGVADTLMLGYVSQTALAASSLAGQIAFILNTIQYGLAAGITTLVAQYWGKGDLATIEKVLAIGEKISLCVSAIFFAAAVFFPGALMRIYTNDPGMIAAGCQYLRVVGFSYLFLGLSQPYLAAMKSIEQVRVSTLINSTALVLNIVLNAVFIFGWIPGVAPMGIQGVALATVIARLVEFLLCIIAGERFRRLRLRPRLLRLRSSVLMKDFIRYSLPALGNDFFWGLGVSMYSVIMGHLGEDIVAAYSVIATIRNLAMVFGFGVANGAAIILGKSIGANEMRKAERDAAQLLRLTFLTALIGSGIVLLCPLVITRVMELTALARWYLNIMIWISAAYVIGPPLNTFFICGVFRAGGDAKFGFIVDFITLWIVFVPVGFLLAFVAHVPPVWVFVWLSLDEFSKMPVVVARYRKKKWLNNITRDELADAQ